MEVGYLSLYLVIGLNICFIVGTVLVPDLLKNRGSLLSPVEAGVWPEKKRRTYLVEGGRMTD